MRTRNSPLRHSRRWFLGTALGGLGCAAARAFSQLDRLSAALPPTLVQSALAALAQHRIERRDVVAIADFSPPSKALRFHLLKLEDGSVSSHWVAHGRGSDPAHTGWLERFSNEPHSNATSAGAYRTGDSYIGAHGRSIRLEGLDATNSNAASRAVVVHGAWYVGAAMVGQWGMLGRSQGCFAVSPESMNEILTRLGPGRLIYAGRV